MRAQVARPARAIQQRATRAESKGPPTEVEQHRLQFYQIRSPKGSVDQRSEGWRNAEPAHPRRRCKRRRPVCRGRASPSLTVCAGGVLASQLSQGCLTANS
eukprot:scaffold5562_cov31-Tisochrysis_lutea.AAC.2